MGNNLDLYPGGWHESLPGGPCTILGAQEGLHGEATLLPWSWSIEEDEPRTVSVLLTCRLIRLPFVLRKRLRLRTLSSMLEIEERLTNESDVEIEFMWGHHPTFGAPFLDGDCRIDAPRHEAVPLPPLLACLQRRARLPLVQPRLRRRP